MNVDKIISIGLKTSYVIFGCYLLIPEKLENYPPIILLLFSALFFLFSKRKKINKRTLIVTSSIYLLFVISIMYSDNINVSIKRIESMASLIVFPLIFYILINSQKLKTQNLYFKLFSQTLFISSLLYCALVMYWSFGYRNPKFPQNDAAFYRNVLSDIPYIGEHPIYVSLIISISILMSIYFYSSNVFKNIIIGIGQVALLAFLLLIMSKGVLIAFFIALIVLFIFRHKRARKWSLFFIPFFILLTIFLIPKENNRFYEIFSLKTYTNVIAQNSTGIRLKVLECDLILIKDNPVWGYGVGDVKDELNNCYTQFENPKIFYNLNSHNQYLFVWLSTGILGLMVFLYILYFYIQIAIKSKDFLFLSIIVLFCISFLFENVLSRQTGVIIFAFVINMLASNNIKKLNNIKKNF